MFKTIVLFSFLLLGLLMLPACGGNLPRKAPQPLVFIELTASDCTDCRQIHQIVQNLKPLYEEKITFLTLDLSSKSNRLNARDTARRFNGEAFVKRYQDSPGTVALLNALTGEKIGMLQHVQEESKFIELIETGLHGIDAF